MTESDSNQTIKLLWNNIYTIIVVTLIIMALGFIVKDRYGKKHNKIMYEMSAVYTPDPVQFITNQYLGRATILTNPYFAECLNSWCNDTLLNPIYLCNNIDQEIVVNHNHIAILLKSNNKDSLEIYLGNLVKILNVYLDSKSIERQKEILMQLNAERIQLDSLKTQIKDHTVYNELLVLRQKAIIAEQTRINYGYLLKDIKTKEIRENVNINTITYFIFLFLLGIFIGINFVLFISYLIKITGSTLLAKIIK